LAVSGDFYTQVGFVREEPGSAAAFSTFSALGCVFGLHQNDN